MFEFSSPNLDRIAVGESDNAGGPSPSILSTCLGFLSDRCIGQWHEQAIRMVCTLSASRMYRMDLVGRCRTFDDNEFIETVVAAAAMAAVRYTSVVEALGLLLAA